MTFLIKMLLSVFLSINWTTNENSVEFLILKTKIFKSNKFKVLDKQHYYCIYSHSGAPMLQHLSLEQFLKHLLINPILPIQTVASKYASLVVLQLPSCMYNIQQVRVTIL